MITTAVSYDSEITSDFPGSLLPLEAATVLQPQHLRQAWVLPPSISPRAGVTPCPAPGSCVQHCTASSAPARGTRAPRTPSSPLSESTPTYVCSALTSYTFTFPSQGNRPSTTISNFNTATLTLFSFDWAEFYFFFFFRITALQSWLLPNINTAQVRPLPREPPSPPHPPGCDRAPDGDHRVT